MPNEWRSCCYSKLIGWILNMNGKTDVPHPIIITYKMMLFCYSPAKPAHLSPATLSIRLESKQRQ